jgi:hypothetical protein
VENLTAYIRELHLIQQHILDATESTCAIIDKIKADQERPEAYQESDLEAKPEDNRKENTEAVVSGGQGKTQAGRQEMSAPENFNQDEIRDEIIELLSAQLKFREIKRKLLESTKSVVRQQLQGLFGELHRQIQMLKTTVETTRVALKTQPAGVETPVRRKDSRNAATCVDSAGEPMGPRSLENE